MCALYSRPLRQDSIGISAISYVLPATTIDLPAAAQRGLLDSPADVLHEFGFRRLHISDRPAHELALDAVRRLTSDSASDPESVDLFLFAAALPASHFVDDGTALAGFNYPAARLQYECGMVRATAIGIAQAGCTGLMSAVAMAADYLRAHPDATRVVCASADVLPPGAKREIIYNVVSDGACALLIERGAVRNRIVSHRSITKGYYWNATTSRNEIVASYFPTARVVVEEVLAEAGIAAADVAAVIPHNVSMRSWQILLPMLGIPGERLFADNIAAVGHVIAADNFINLEDARAAGRINPGDHALLFNFGFGANWAALIVSV
jgi:3-oxoacyl-[acyl-carrier-protein] synthase III